MKLSMKTAAVAAILIIAGFVMTALDTPEALGASPLPDKAADWSYVGQGQCKVCHNSAKEGSQWDKWHDSEHREALDLLKTDKAKAAAEAAGVTTPPAESPECLKCHVTGYDETAKAAPAKISMADGIQCESCHGPSSEHLKDARVLKFTPEKISEMDIRAHLLPVTEETCRGCHNDTSPTWKDDRYTLESGEKVGFDFEQAGAKIAHEYPEGVMEDKYAGEYPVD